MYHTFLTLHSLTRWLVIVSLIYAVYTGWMGYRRNSIFTSLDNSLRHVTATIVHIQLLLGLYLYMISPIVKYRVVEANSTNLVSEHLFFKLIHMAMMAIAVVVITIGSAKAKRAETDKLKFRTMLVWFTVGLLLILAAIPWPFSPFAHRPYYRSF